MDKACLACLRGPDDCDSEARVPLAGLLALVQILQYRERVHIALPAHRVRGQCRARGGISHGAAQYLADRCALPEDQARRGHEVWVAVQRELRGPDTVGQNLS